MTLQFQLTFKRAAETIAVVQGQPVDGEYLTVTEVAEKVVETEQFLEKLTGLRVHIEEAGAQQSTDQSKRLITVPKRR